MPLLKLVRSSPDLRRTNELLERIALALERLSPEIPAVPDEELVSLVFDDAEEERIVDESEGLREPDSEGDEGGALEEEWEEVSSRQTRSS